MKHKILSLLLLGLVCSIGNAWAASRRVLVDFTFPDLTSTSSGSSSGTGWSAEWTSVGGSKNYATHDGVNYYKFTSGIAYDDKKGTFSKCLIITLSEDGDTFAAGDSIYFSIYNGQDNKTDGLNTYTTSATLVHSFTATTSSTAVVIGEGKFDASDFAASGKKLILGRNSSNCFINNIKIVRPATFTVTYDANGGSGTIDDATGASITLSDGTGLTAPTGYSFAGWNTDAHGTGTAYESEQSGVASDLVLYAVWTQDGTIDDNGGSADGSYTATYNKATIDITTVPTYTNSVVSGYYEAGTDENLIASTSGALETSTTYTDVSGYWTHTGSAPTLYAQWTASHSVTVNVNDNDMGTASAEDDNLAAGGTTQITATAKAGYKFDSWAVSGTGASLSSTTTNPTTLTMGTANATVTATFRALNTYTISYAAGTPAEDISGSKKNETKTEDAPFTLPSTAVFTRSGYVQTGWATSDGGTKAYDLGGSYETNAAQTFYPFWTAAYTLTYDTNGGTGSMEAQQGVGSITLTANTYTKSGYTFVGWNTEADGSGTSYADKASYTLSANATIYAQWAENCFEFTPTLTSGDLSDGDIAATSTGGKLVYTPKSGSGSAPSMSYSSAGLTFGGGGRCWATITLNDYLQEGSIITMKLQAGADGARGLKITDANEQNVKSLGWGAEGKNEDIATFSYTITSSDATYINSKEIKIQRNNTVYLQSLTVTNCQPGATTTSTGWCTYSNNKALDLSTLTSGFIAYVAKEVSGGNVIMKSTDAIVPANTGLMIKGTAGAKFTINATSDAATFSGTNLLVAMPEGGSVTAANNTSEWNYVFGYTDAETYGFYRINDESATLGLGKAYLHTTSELSASSAPSIFRIVEEENNATNIENLTSTDNAVKFFENGQLFILKNGITYDLLGRIVK